MKIEMMRKNPHICFQVGVMEDLSNWRSAIAWGRFEELKTPDKRKMGMQILVDRVMSLLTGASTIHHATIDRHGKYIEAMRGVVYRIRLTQKTGRFEKS